MTVITLGFGAPRAGEVPDRGLFPSDLRGLLRMSSQEISVPAPSIPEVTPSATAESSEDDRVQAALDGLRLEDVPETTDQEAQQPFKELFSHFRIRYVAKGQANFRLDPPSFTTSAGKVFRLVNYPAWLKEAGDATICVEGYLKQREKSDDFRITKMLPPDAFDSIERAPHMREVERDPFLMSHMEGRYVLGNVAWSIRHNADGGRIKDGYGNMLTDWQSGVSVNPELLEKAYFVKKSDLKPVKHGGHGLLMFTFKPGGVKAADGRQSRGLVVTLDAYHKDLSNMSYSIVDALKGKYSVYYTIQTIERYSEFRLAERPEVMSLYPLRLTSSRQLELLDTAIFKAVESNLGEMYSLFYNSCANSALALINGVLDDDRKIKEGWLPEIVYRVKTFMPDAITALLLKKNIADKPLPEVNGRNFQYAYNF